MEAIAPLTGRDPVPEYKRARFRHESAKFEAAGLTPQSSQAVSPDRVRECPVQLEATVANIHQPAESGFAIVEAQVRRVHVAAELVVPGTQHVDLQRWRPLFYVFRHYFGLGDELASNFRAEY